MMPEIGKQYTKNGFVFRVDFIEKGQVYYARWPEGAEAKDGALLRVNLSDWERQMGDDP